MTKLAKPRVHLLADSIGDSDGNHFVARYDENNKPNQFEINGVVVTEAEYRSALSARIARLAAA